MYMRKKIGFERFPWRKVGPFDDVARGAGFGAQPQLGGQTLLFNLKPIRPEDKPWFPLKTLVRLGGQTLQKNALGPPEETLMSAWGSIPPKKTHLVRLRKP